MYVLMPALRKQAHTLEHLFDLYNPERQQEGGKIWTRMLAKAKQGEYPVEEGRTPLLKARIGDTIRVGQEGTRDTYLDKVERITPTGIVKTKRNQFQYNQKTGMAKGQKRKTFAQVATDKDKEKEFRKWAIGAIRSAIERDLTTEQIEALLKHLRISIYDARAEKYTDV